jgi:hypothetical protein
VTTATRRPPRPPDELSAEARRWLTQHHGPATPATRRVRLALAIHYGDLTVIDGILRWKAANRG